MKKAIALLLAAAMLLSMTACSTEQSQSTGVETGDVSQEKAPVIIPFDNVEIKASPDKYTWYIKNYVGKNAASVGYTSMGGARMDSYGSGYIELILLTPNGEYVDIHDEDDLKNWRIIGQNLEPNTEIKYTFDVDSDGNEYDNLIATQNIEEIVLAVAPVGGSVDAPTMTAINTTADRYTLYIRDYVGRNLTQCGYTSMGGNRMDAYGAAYVQLTMVTTNGDFVDIGDEESMKNWVVVAQNILPNTELKLTYDVDPDGKEYDNLVAYQNVEEILLAVAPVGEDAEVPVMTAIDPSPDKYTAYISDYVGRTLSHCGYVSMGGKLMDQYGNAYVHLAVYADDGSYVDIHDNSDLKNYVVVAQNVAPNTELKMVYSVDSKGNEYDNLVDTQNIEEIELAVTKVNSYTEEPEETVPETEADRVDGLDPEFKAAMDSYEAFFDEYVEFMIAYKASDDVVSMAGKYTAMMTEYLETMTALQEVDQETLSNEEALYYAEVMLRINQKLLEVV